MAENNGIFQKITAKKGMGQVFTAFGGVIVLMIIFDEPTRGIDVAAKVEIYEIINELKKQGKAVIVISSEMPEVMGISDRILVMCEGRITGELTAEEATENNILSCAMRFEDKAKA